MKIHLLSDVHNEFGVLQPPETDADVIVLAGDIWKGDKGVRWMKEAFPDKPVIYVLGNHEYYGYAYPKLVKDLKPLTEGTNIHFLENDSVEIEGVRFLGCTLWTDFSLNGDPPAAMLEAGCRMNDYRKIRLSPLFKKLAPYDTAAIHRESKKWLEAQLKSGSQTTVVVTHHAPSAQSIEQLDQLSSAYATDLEYLMENYSPKLWLHGHTHEPVDYQVGMTRVVSNPRGYVGHQNTGYNPSLILEV